MSIVIGIRFASASTSGIKSCSYQDEEYVMKILRKKFPNYTIMKKTDRY